MLSFALEVPVTSNGQRRRFRESKAVRRYRLACSNMPQGMNRIRGQKVGRDMGNLTHCHHRQVDEPAFERVCGHSYPHDYLQLE